MLHVLVGICFGGLGYMNIKMHAGYLWVVGFEVQVLKFMFMVCDFQLAKTNVALSPKHAMFPCWFILELVLLVCGNPCRVALK
jgi:hypothetical protein